MVITYTTINKIDEQTLKGLPIGHYGNGDDLTTLPKMLGDWSIKTITEDRNPGTGYIVAIPTNTRTKAIYRSGRINWLISLGYNEEQATLYFRACGKVQKKWDLRVAMFVLEHFTTDHFIIEGLYLSLYPKLFGLENHVHIRISNTKVHQACQILLNIRNLT